MRCSRRCGLAHCGIYIPCINTIMDKFEKCLNFVLKWEGCYTDGKTGASKHDRGGATNYGITCSVLGDWCALHPDFPTDVSDLTKDQAAKIYKSLYFDKSGCGSLPEGLDLAVFDSAVNCGSGRAVKWLQEVVGVKADGQFGPLTTQMVALEIERVGVKDVLRRFMDKRFDHYAEIVERNPSQAVFAKGWDRRMHDLEREVS